MALFAVNMRLLADGVMEASTDYLLNTKSECDALLQRLEQKLAHHYDLSAPYAMRVLPDRRIIFYGEQGNLWEAIISIELRGSEKKEVAHARGTDS